MALHDGAPDADRLIPTSRARRLGGRGAFRGMCARASFLAAHSAFVAFVALGSGSAALAVDSTPAPGVQLADPPTCAERFPAEGPAGVDLRLGCIVSEVVGLYTAGQAAPPPPLSSYAIAVAGLALATVVALWLVGRLVARRAGRRLAPVLAAAWWVCASCRSVNAAGVAHCYSCGSGPPDGPMLTTDEHPEIAQSFGSIRKRG